MLSQENQIGKKVRYVKETYYGKEENLKVGQVYTVQDDHGSSNIRVGIFWIDRENFDPVMELTKENAKVGAKVLYVREDKAWGEGGGLVLGREYTISDYDSSSNAIRVKEYKGSQFLHHLPHFDLVSEAKNKTPKKKSNMSKIFIPAKRHDQLFPGFMPGDIVELIPDSYDPHIEAEDRADEGWEDLNSGYPYEVERVVRGYWKQEDPGMDKRPNTKLEWLTLVHDEVCGGSGYSIPAYRFKRIDKPEMKFKEGDRVIVAFPHDPNIDGDDYAQTDDIEKKELVVKEVLYTDWNKIGGTNQKSTDYREVLVFDDPSSKGDTIKEAAYRFDIAPKKLRKKSKTEGA